LPSREIGVDWFAVMYREKIICPETFANAGGSTWFGKAKVSGWLERVVFLGVEAGLES